MAGQVLPSTRAETRPNPCWQHAGPAHHQMAKSPGWSAAGLPHLQGAWAVWRDLIAGPHLLILGPDLFPPGLQLCALLRSLAGSDESQAWWPALLCPAKHCAAKSRTGGSGAAIKPQMVSYMQSEAAAGTTDMLHGGWHSAVVDATHATVIGLWTRRTLHGIRAVRRGCCR